MNSAQSGAQSLRKFLTMLRGLTEAEAELEALGSIQAATAEAKSRFSAIQSEETQARERASGIVAAAEEQKREAQALLRSARLEGTNIVSAAKTKAAELMDDAKGAAKLLKDEARQELAEATGTRKKLSDALAAVQATT